MPDPTAQLDVDQSKTRTAELLGVPIEELDYITRELLQMPPTDASPPAEETSEEGDDVESAVVPNRISYISHIQGSIPMNGRWNIMFYEGCRYGTRYLMWNNQIHRWERNGSCRVPNGNYVPRFKLWWRQ